MDLIAAIICQSVYLFLGALMWLLVARVLLGFFADGEEPSPALTFCTVVTEPVVYPVRNFLSRIPALQESPIDFTFMATSLILILVRLALPV